MAWIYFTTISPYNNSYEEALSIFFGQCLIAKERLSEHLMHNECYRFLVKTDENNNTIKTKDNKIYYKSKFLSSKGFKKMLVEHYRPLGIYVKGPTELITKDSCITNRWMIELSVNKSYA